MRRDMEDGAYDEDAAFAEQMKYGVVYPESFSDEQVVLGACMLDPEAAQWTVTHANVQDFYRSAHRDIFRAIEQVVEAGDEASIVSVSGVLRRAQALEQWGGAEYLISMTQQVPTTVHARQSLRALRELRALRGIVDLGNTLMKKAGEKEAKPLELMGQGIEHLHKVPELLTVDQREYITAEQALENLRDIEWMWESWVPRANLTMLIAQPGVGKSALALWLAGALATGGAWPDGTGGGAPERVLYCDTESSQALLLTRIRDWGLAPTGLILPGDDGMHRLRLDKPDSLDLACRTVQREGVGLVVIDSLRTAFDGDENSSEVADVLSPWIAAAAEHDFALMVVHHLRKRKEGEGDRVTLDRMRGSSALPALARSIIALTPMAHLHRPPLLASPAVSTRSAPQRSSLRELPTDPPSPARAGARVEVIKSNFAAPPWPLMMTLDSAGCYFERWDDETMSLSDAPTPTPPTLQERVQDHLRERLADGPVAASEIVAECKEEFGASRASVYRARDAIGVESVKLPGADANMWGIAGDDTREDSPQSQPVLLTGGVRR